MQKNNSILSKKRLDETVIINNIVTDVKACLLFWNKMSINNTNRLMCTEWNIRRRLLVG